MGCVFRSDKLIHSMKDCDMNRFLLKNGDSAVAYGKIQRNYNATINGKSNSMS